MCSILELYMCLNLKNLLVTYPLPIDEIVPKAYAIHQAWPTMMIPLPISFSIMNLMFYSIIQLVVTIRFLDYKQRVRIQVTYHYSFDIFFKNYCKQ